MTSWSDRNPLMPTTATGLPRILGEVGRERDGTIYIILKNKTWCDVCMKYAESIAHRNGEVSSGIRFYEMNRAQSDYHVCREENFTDLFCSFVRSLRLVRDLSFRPGFSPSDNTGKNCSSIRLRATEKWPGWGLRSCLNGRKDAGESLDRSYNDANDDAWEAAA